jgi:hypothetical protein
MNTGDGLVVSVRGGREPAVARGRWAGAHGAQGAKGLVAS